MIVIERLNDHEVTLTFPFSAEFVADLKSAVRFPLRRWIPEDRVWAIRIAAFSRVHELLETHFPGMEMKVAQDAADMIREQYESTIERPMLKSYPNSWGPYRELYLNDDAPECVVSAAYKALARVYHPDLGGDGETMSRINQAYEEIRVIRNW
jgi:hypothetical protein